MKENNNEQLIQNVDIINDKKQKEIFNDYEIIDENKLLMTEESKNQKQNLINILNSLSTTLQENENKGIIQIYEEKYSNNDDELISKEIIPNINKCCLYFMYYVILPIFSIIYIAGMFYLISIYKAFSKVFFASIFSKQKEIDNYINLFKSDFNFRLNFVKESLIKNYDFNLLMPTNFIGDLLLKYKGFGIISTLLFFLNCYFVLLINHNLNMSNNNFEDNFAFGYLLIYYFFLFILVGASSLLSQQILIDSFLKLKSYLNKKEEIINSDNLPNINEQKKIKKNKFDYFFMVCITTMLGKLLKFLVCSSQSDKIYQYNKDYNLSYIININNINNTYSNESELNLSILNEKYADYNVNFCFDNFFISFFIYIAFYIIFACIFIKKKKKNNEKENKYNIYQICGYTIYKQNIKKNKKIAKCECIKLFGKSLKICFDELFENNEYNTEFDRLVQGLSNKENKNNKCCNCCKCCCCCCCEYNDVSYEQNEVSFYYCYQGERKYSWFKNYISSQSQKKIIPFLFNYFYLSFIVILFDVKLEEKEEKNFIEKPEENIITILIFIISFILFFLITILFSEIKIFNYDQSKKDGYMAKISKNVINGAQGILYFAAIYTLILSLFIEVDWETGHVKEFNNTIKYFAMIPTLMSKFNLFTINYYCICYSGKTNNFEMISGTSLISLYLNIYHLDYNFIKSSFKETSETTLFLT